MVLGKLPVLGRPTVWITVGQGPTALVVGAGGGCLDIFTLVCPFLSSLSLTLGDGPIYTEILSQRAINPKQPTNQSGNSGTVLSGVTLYFRQKFFNAHFQFIIS